MREEDQGRKTLVLDLDETLVHSSFKPIPNPGALVGKEDSTSSCNPLWYH